MRKILFCTMVLSISAFVLTLHANAQGVVLGGYKEIPKTDANAKKAALFAVSAEAKRSEKEIEFIAVIKAERQSVRGTNYRMCLKVSDSGAEGQDAAEVFVKTVVFDDLKGNYKLTSWEASDCGEGEDGGGSPSALASAGDKGFKTVSKNDAGIGLAADFAIKKRSSDTKVKHTLAGILKGENKGMFAMTYRVRMKVAKDDKTQVIRTVVTMDQYSNMKLVSWEHSNCGN
jgi:hypothetical protein